MFFKVIVAIFRNRNGSIAVVNEDATLHARNSSGVLVYRPLPVALFVVGGCSGETGRGTKFAGLRGTIVYGSMNAFCPGHGVTARMQSRIIGAAASAALMISLSATGSAAIAD